MKSIGLHKTGTNVNKFYIQRDFMPVEIERKYLVKGEPWKEYKGTYMEQGYLAKNEATVRVRTSSEKAWVTIKGLTHGFSRPEYEYEIPLSDAKEMLDMFCGMNKVSKTRYEIDYKGLTWEVDVFEGKNKGLIVAEVELESEDVEIQLPDWIGKDVTNDPRYRNSNLLENPGPFED